MLQPGADRKANVRIVVDNQNAAHDGILCRPIRVVTPRSL
jgi:hypothetical protein